MAQGTKFTVEAGDFVLTTNTSTTQTLLAAVSTGVITIGVSAAAGANASGIPIVGTYTSATSVTAAGNNLSIPVVDKNGVTYYLIARSSAM